MDKSSLSPYPIFLINLSQIVNTGSKISNNRKDAKSEISTPTPTPTLTPILAVETQTKETFPAPHVSSQEFYSLEELNLGQKLNNLKMYLKSLIDSFDSQNETGDDLIQTITSLLRFYSEDSFDLNSEKKKQLLKIFIVARDLFSLEFLWSLKGKKASSNFDTTCKLLEILDLIQAQLSIFDALNYNPYLRHSSYFLYSTSSFFGSIYRRLHDIFKEKNSESISIFLESFQKIKIPNRFLRIFDGPQLFYKSILDFQNNNLEIEDIFRKITILNKLIVSVIDIDPNALLKGLQKGLQKGSIYNYFKCLEDEFSDLSIDLRSAPGTAVENYIGFANDFMLLQKEEFKHNVKDFIISNEGHMKFFFEEAEINFLNEIFSDLRLNLSNLMYKLKIGNFLPRDFIIWFEEPTSNQEFFKLKLLTHVIEKRFCLKVYSSIFGSLQVCKPFNPWLVKEIDLFL